MYFSDVKFTKRNAKCTLRKYVYKKTITFNWIFLSNTVYVETRYVENFNLKFSDTKAKNNKSEKFYGEDNIKTVYAKI